MPVRLSLQGGYAFPFNPSRIAQCGHIRLTGEGRCHRTCGGASHFLFAKKESVQRKVAGSVAAGRLLAQAARPKRKYGFKMLLYCSSPRLESGNPARLGARDIVSRSLLYSKMVVVVFKDAGSISFLFCRMSIAFM